MNPTDQSTPRTDAVTYEQRRIDRLFVYSPKGQHVEAEFARTLERELAATKAECEKLKFALVEWEAKERGWSKAVEKDAAELTRLRAEVEAARLRGDVLQAEVDRWTKWHSDQPWLAEIYGYQKQLARAEKAEADTARINWLEKRGPWDSWDAPGEAGVTLTTSDIRANIDAAMKDKAADPA
jgi:hypothetical protein